MTLMQESTDWFHWDSDMTSFVLQWSALQVEEVSAAVNDKKRDAQSTDPMEKFCEGNEDADECRVYGKWLSSDNGELGAGS